jgi:hypothetical protein
VAVFNIQVQKTQALDKKKEEKAIKQTYNTITRNRKDKKQPYRTKNKHKTSNTNLQDNKITH